MYPQFAGVCPFDWTGTGQKVHKAVKEEGERPMAGANRILTVSYGTFSCTLEGFDDPLGTMQEIAEYFRRVAAEDRYFGAAPPTPDAAMLHRIAERAVNRHADTPIKDTSVILREDVAEHPSIPSVPLAPQAESQPAPAPEATGLLAQESVAAKLQRIRAAVARGEDPAEEAFHVGGEDAAPVPVAPPAFSAGTEEDVIERMLVPPDHGPGPGPDAAGPAGLPDMPVTTGGAGGDHGEDRGLRPGQPADDLPESVEPAPDAARLDRLTGGQADMATLSFNPLGDISDAFPETLPELTAEDLPEAAGSEDEALPDSFARALAEAGIAFSRDGETVPGPPLKPAVADRTPESAVAPSPLALRDATSFPGDWKDVLSAFEEPSEWTRPAPALPPAPDLPDEAVGAGAEPSAGPSAVSDGLGLEGQHLLVLHPTEPSADPAGPGPDRIQAGQSDVSSRAEATRPAEGRTDRAGHARDEEDVTRLLHQASTEMDEPENIRRLSTMAHLKAAVVAREADLQSAGGDSKTGVARRLDRYHADLVRAVQQHRPDGSPPSGRSAPLVLVSEQRIDRPVPDGAIIRGLQQRISITDLAIGQRPDAFEDAAWAEDAFAPALSFSEFAEQVGAGAMPDILEAAAAYTVCIEKQPHFARPHLMRLIAEAFGTGDAIREESMRSFGLLLRQGKIAKADGGLFAVTESCAYLPQARRLAR